MKKTFLSIGMLFCAVLLSAQEQLYYFIHPQDSLVGVRNSRGEVVIAPAGNPIYNYDYETPIRDSLIYIEHFDKNENGVSYASGMVFDRRGQLLYRPMSYDNGPDYFLEGVSRFVENGKAGFVNRQGVKVIPAQWDWVSSFNYGYAYACNNCYFDRGKDPEHPPLVLKPGSTMKYINKQGKIVLPAKMRKSEKDLPVEGGFLPYAFSYNGEDQKIVNEFSGMEVLSKIRNASYASRVTGKMAVIQFEIIERPTKDAPWYLVQGYSAGDFRIEDRFTFHRTVSGELFHISTYGPEKVPFKTWLKEALLSCMAYFENHPDAPNRFDAEKYLEEPD